MYNLILYLYQLGIILASFFSKKVKLMRKGECEAFNILKEKIDNNAKYVWFHAASLGEFEQGRPIIERLRKEHPEYKILLTFFSPSGYEVRKNYEGADIICYLPIDTIVNAKKFLKLVNPYIVFFIKYEFWYNYLNILKHRNIPIYSVSSIFRPQQIFFRWYGKQYSQVLKCFTKFFVQNQQSKELLATLNITNVEISGDTRMDRVLQIRNNATDLPIVETFVNNKPCFIAGSSWQPDEQIYIPYFNKNRQWKLIIAPHVIDESHLSEIEKLLEGRKVLRYTDIELKSQKGESVDSMLKDAEVMIINCFGKLSSIYRYARIVLVGGGFGVGIHNVPEAAVYGIPVIIGPNNQRFQEAQELLQIGGCFEIKESKDFITIMQNLSDNTTLRDAGYKAGSYIKNKSGAVDKIMQSVF